MFLDVKLEIILSRSLVPNDYRHGAKIRPKEKSKGKSVEVSKKTYIIRDVLKPIDL